MIANPRSEDHGATAKLGPGRDTVVVECFAGDSEPAWSLRQANMFAADRRESLSRALTKLEAKLDQRLDSPCLTR